MKTMKSIDLRMTLLVALLAIVVGHQSQANRQASARPAVIAFVDLQELFQGLDERAAADQELEQIAIDLDEAGVARRAEIDALNDEREIYQPGSENHQTASKKIAQKTYALQAYLDFAVRKLDNEKGRVLAEIYDSIKETVRQLAAENGYDAVFVDDAIVEIPGGRGETETMRQISARRSLYTNPELDITSVVMTRMNAQFNKK